jgi:HK97 family phage prohead protease
MATRNAKMPHQIRAASTVPATLNEEARTIEVVMTTEAPVRRFDFDRWSEYDEILLMSGADLGRVPGAAVCDSHRTSGVANVVGVIEAAWIDGDKLMGRLRFSSRDDVSPIWQDIKDGILTSVSIGYAVKRLRFETNDGGIDKGFAESWELHECSLVPVPADKNAKFRSADDEDETVEIIEDVFDEQVDEPASDDADQTKEVSSEDQSESVSESTVQSAAEIAAEVAKIAIDGGCERDLPGMLSRSVSVEEARAFVVARGEVRKVVDLAATRFRSVITDAVRSEAMGKPSVDAARSYLFDVLCRHDQATEVRGHIAPSPAEAPAGPKTIDASAIYARRSGGGSR